MRGFGVTRSGLARAYFIAFSAASYEHCWKTVHVTVVRVKIGSVIQLVTFQVAATLQRCWSVRRQSSLNAFLVCTPDSTCLCPGRLEVNGRFRVGRVNVE